MQCFHTCKQFLIHHHIVKESRVARHNLFVNGSQLGRRISFGEGKEHRSHAVKCRRKIVKRQNRIFEGRRFGVVYYGINRSISFSKTGFKSRLIVLDFDLLERRDSIRSVERLHKGIIPIGLR